MKTFLTEKGNIPEGATHYSNENDDAYFCWFKGIHSLSLKVMSDNTNGVWVDGDPDDYIDNGVKPIPQTKEVEWVNGDECRYTNDIEHEYTYIGEHPHGDGHYVFSEEKGITYIANGYLIKPETPEQKLEREELESAYSLHVKCAHAGNLDFNSFKSDDNVVKFWVRIVKETNYKVKGE